MHQAGLRGDGQITGANMIDQPRGTGADAEAFPENPGVERVDMTELRAEQADQFLTREEARKGAGQKIQALAGGRQGDFGNGSGDSTAKTVG